MRINVSHHILFPLNWFHADRGHSTLCGLLLAYAIMFSTQNTCALELGCQGLEELARDPHPYISMEPKSLCPFVMVPRIIPYTRGAALGIEDCWPSIRSQRRAFEHSLGRPLE
eukprot:scaffold2280_cov430-Prasinococcus_capsulatus_cf.AAC.29